MRPIPFSTGRRLPLAAFALALLVAPAASADMVIAGGPAYYPNSDRFYGPGGNFVFSNFNFTGVGSTANAQGTTGANPPATDPNGVGEGFWGTLISNDFFLTANHVAGAVNQLTFYPDATDTNNPVTASVAQLWQLKFSYIDPTTHQLTTVNSDLELGRLSTPVPGKIRPYSLVNNANPDSVIGATVYTVGRPYRVGVNTIATVYGTPDRMPQGVLVPGASQGIALEYVYNPSDKANPYNNYLVGGDSSGPSFLNVGGNLALVGISWYDGTDSNFGNAQVSGASYIPYYNSQIATIMAQFGESPSLVTYSVPEPSSLALVAAGLASAAAFASRRRRGAA